jgi:hypothetical protein
MKGAENIQQKSKNRFKFTSQKEKHNRRLTTLSQTLAFERHHPQDAE